MINPCTTTYFYNISMAPLRQIIMSISSQGLKISFFSILSYINIFLIVSVYKNNEN